MSESLGENFESKITSFFTYKMCFIIDDFDECFNSDLKIKNFSYIMDPLIKSECGLIIVTKRPFDEFKNEVYSYFIIHYDNYCIKYYLLYSNLEE